MDVSVTSSLCDVDKTSFSDDVTDVALHVAESTGLQNFSSGSDMDEMIF